MAHTAFTGREASSRVFLFPPVVISSVAPGNGAELSHGAQLQAATDTAMEWLREASGQETTSS